MASIFKNIASDSIPTTFKLLSSIPKIICPPRPLAKATTVFMYLSLFGGISTLYSTFTDSPENKAFSNILFPPNEIP